MNRSPDDIFAAQLWSWPDPAMKRDPHGRVLFVNAAFLQLFGGTVESWHGQVIQGWHLPQSGYTPSRFEIRTPANEYGPEQVYDWIEQTGRDGNAFAMARNVTAFAQAAYSVPTETAPTEVHAQADVAQEVVSAPPVADAAPVAQAAPPLDPSAYVAAAVAEPVVDVPVVPPVEVVPTVQETPQDIQVAPPIQAHAQPTIEAQHSIAEPQLPVAEPSMAQPSESYRQEERDFERRALPIEDDEAVLGNNWRDAVIAKAVGQDEGEATSPSLIASEDTSAAPNADGIRILLAEDNAINALLTRTLLEADGHTVETVEDGVLAVEAMKTSSYDMIFMDMRMPNMDGLEATRNIRRLPNVPQDLPIVALTANAFDDDRNACFDSGMNDFMTKPVSAEELSEMVVRWTNQDEQRMAS